MIANPEKFHLLFPSPNKQDLMNQQSMGIGGISLGGEARFALLGVDINNRLAFHGHIDGICGKAAGQINAFGGLSVHMGGMQKWPL